MPGYKGKKAQDMSLEVQPHGGQCTASVGDTLLCAGSLLNGAVPLVCS